MRTIAHIVNPVMVGPESDLSVAQPLVFESMRVAKEYAKGRVEISLYSAQYPEDYSMVPSYFTKTPDLQRSVLDVCSFQIPRKLPLLQDIIDRLYKASDAQYFIYTNADIILLPQFYVVVDALLNKKYDAMSILKRIIPSTYTDVADLSLIYAYAGAPHIGHDCIMFPRSIVPDLYVGDACIGAPLVGAALIVPIIASVPQFRVFRDLHITCHIEDPAIWRQEQFQDYRHHNLTEYRKIWAQYSERVRANAPGLYDAFKRRTEGPLTWRQRTVRHLRGGISNCSLSAYHMLLPFVRKRTWARCVRKLLKKDAHGEAD
jgi:hypothetical protein